MPPILRALYEALRDAGAYDTDWLDRALWRAFAAFVVLIILLG